MLSGRETVPSAFAATAWREGSTDLARRVRLLTLGLGDVGVVAPPSTTAATIAVLAAGGTLDLDAEPLALPEVQLIEAGTEIDRREPDAYERRTSTVAPGDVAALGDGGRAWTHGALLCGARSFGQGVGLAPGVRLELADELEGVRRLVLRTLVPAVSGASVVDARPEVLVWSAADAIATVRPAVESLPAGRLRRRAAARATVQALGLTGCRLVLVTGDAAVAVDWLRLLGLHAEPLLIVAGCAAPVRADRPFPGVTVGVADDGELVLRSGFVAIDAVAGDGWLHTGIVDA